MSKGDIDQNRQLVRSFIRRRCFATLATNSIKLFVDDPSKKGRYIWIDPPWFFYGENGEITSSDKYSEANFQEWVQLFSPVRDAVLERFEESDQGAAAFYFGGKYKLLVPDDGHREAGTDYDQWYAIDRRNQPASDQPATG